MMRTLARVRRILAKGNRVVVGEGDGQSYIEGVNGKKIMVNNDNGIYTLSVEYLQVMIECFTGPAAAYFRVKRLQVC